MALTAEKSKDENNLQLVSVAKISCAHLLRMEKGGGGGGTSHPFERLTGLEFHGPRKRLTRGIREGGCVGPQSSCGGEAGVSGISVGSA
jgi:hypothetical protein